MDISVVIPAFNEESFIENTITSIKKWVPEQYNYEIIVVDHGSRDNTVSLARDAGAQVVDGKEISTIAALRNLGVKHSEGKLLFFIDADITFTSFWSKNISKVVEELEKEPMQITGSFPKVPPESSVFIKYWFDPKVEVENPNYLGSGHLLTSRKLFEAVGGFPSEQETGEDLNFCANAKKIGAKINSHSELFIYHQGAPKTMSEFIKREIWHGRGDWTSFASFMTSKAAMLTVLFFLLHLLAIFGVIIGQISTESVLVVIGVIILLCLFSALKKYSKYGMRFVVINVPTFYVYFTSRTISIFSKFLSSGTKKRTRNKQSSE